MSAEDKLGQQFRVKSIPEIHADEEAHVLSEIGRLGRVTNAGRGTFPNGVSSDAVYRLAKKGHIDMYHRTVQEAWNRSHGEYHAVMPGGPEPTHVLNSGWKRYQPKAKK